MGASLSLMFTSTMGHWGLCSTGFFLHGPCCRAATTVTWKRGEPQRVLWLDVSSSAKLATPTHGLLAGTSFWSHTITRGQRVQCSSCTEGEDNQVLQAALGTTTGPWRSSGPEPSGCRWGNAAGTERQCDFPQVTCPAKLRGGEEAQS